MHLLGRMLPGPAETALPSPRNSDYRVLFIRYDRADDMIMATSLIRNIAMALPSGKVDVLGTQATAAVLEGNPHVGNILLLDRRSMKSYRQLIKRLRGERYTVMVDGRINNPPIFISTPLLMYASRARFRVGAQGDRKPRIYNVAVPEWNRVEHYIEGSKHLAAPFGVNPASVDWRPEIFLSPEEQTRAKEWWNEARSLVATDETASHGITKCLLVNLSASEPKRRWPDGKFIATLSAARERAPKMPIIVIGDAGGMGERSEGGQRRPRPASSDSGTARRIRLGGSRGSGIHPRYQRRARRVSVPQAIIGAAKAGAQTVRSVEYAGRDHRVE